MLLRRYSAKSVMMIGLGILILTTFALIWTQTIVAVLILRLLSGVGMALYNVSRHEYIAASIVQAKRGRSIATFGGVHRIGWFAGPATGGFVAAAFGLRAPFLIFGVAAVLALLVVIVFVKVTAPIRGQRETSSMGGHLLETVKSNYRVLMIAGGAQLFSQMVRTGRQVMIPLYGADVVGLDVEAIGLIVSIAASLEVVLFYPAGMIMDRFGRKYAIVPPFIGMAIGMIMIPFTSDFTGLLLVGVFMGLSNGFSSGTMMTMGTDLAPEDSRSEFLGVWRLIGDTGASGAPIIVGRVADTLSLGLASWVMAGAGIIAAALFAFGVPEPLKKKPALMKADQPDPSFAQ
jgi:MFS family permease